MTCSSDSRSDTTSGFPRIIQAVPLLLVLTLLLLQPLLTIRPAEAKVKPAPIVLERLADGTVKKFDFFTGLDKTVQHFAPLSNKRPDYEIRSYDRVLNIDSEMGMWCIDEDWVERLYRLKGLPDEELKKGHMRLKIEGEKCLEKGQLDKAMTYALASIRTNPDYDETGGIGWALVSKVLMLDAEKDLYDAWQNNEDYSFGLNKYLMALDARWEFVDRNAIGLARYFGRDKTITEQEKEILEKQVRNTDYGYISIAKTIEKTAEQLGFDNLLDEKKGEKKLREKLEPTDDAGYKDYCEYMLKKNRTHKNMEKDVIALFKKVD